MDKIIEDLFDNFIKLKDLIIEILLEILSIFGFTKSDFNNWKDEVLENATLIIVLIISLIIVVFVLGFFLDRFMKNKYKIKIKKRTPKEQVGGG